MSALTQIKSAGKTVWVSKPAPDEDFNLKLNDLLVLTVIREVLAELDKDFGAEIIMQSAERLGEQVYERYVAKESVTTPLEWAKALCTNVFNRMGIGIQFEECTDEKLVANIFQCPTVERAMRDANITCGFSYGFAKGLWQKAFPEGTVKMGRTKAKGAPTCEFVFYTKRPPAASSDVDDRELAKCYLVCSSKEEQRCE
jgi:predicted ArsR family transcriptional regulator